MHHPSILLVDDDPVAIASMGQVLDGLGEVRVATNGADALRLAHVERPTLMLLDAEMPEMNGFEVFDHLRTHQHLAQVPVIFVSSHNEPAFELASFGRGALDFIAKPLSPDLARARISAHLQARRQIESMAWRVRTDAQTDLLNPAGFAEALRREWRRAQRQGDAIALLRLEVDGYDDYRQLVGANVATDALSTLGRALVALCRRPADAVARTREGGFSLLLPSTPRAGAQHLALRALETVARLRLSHPGSPAGQALTASVGIAGFDNDSPCWISTAGQPLSHGMAHARRRTDDLLNAADAALMAAQAAGTGQARFLDIADLGLARQAASRVVRTQLRSAWAQSMPLLKH